MNYIQHICELYTARYELYAAHM